MDLPSQPVIAVLNYLLPGFIAASILYTLTPAPRPVPFERLVQALIFTIIVQVLVLGMHSALLAVGNTLSVGAWTDNVRLTWSVVLAGALGLLLAWASNTDKVHSMFRAMRITCQTSFESEWYGAFARNEGYVVLHLTGERRLYGWPEEWPSVPRQGQFVMAEAEWLDGSKRIPLTGVRRVLIRAEEVEMVEFMEVVGPAEENRDGRP